MLRYAIALCTIALSTGGISAEPMKLRVDYTSSPGQSAAVMSVVPKYGPNVYRHYGKSYVIDPLQMAGGGVVLTAITSGETDVSGFTPQMVVLGKDEVKLDFKIIGQQLSDGVPGNARTFWWVRKAEIQNIADLKGKTIAINARGANPDAALRMTMNKNGMADGKDYQIVEIRFPAMMPSLMEKRVDAAILIPPFYLPAEKNPDLKPLFAVDDVFGPNETVMWAVRSDFLAKNRAVLVDFLEDAMRYRRWIRDPKTRADAMKAVAEITKQPPEALSEWVNTEKDYYIDLNCAVNVARLQKNVEDMQKLGITKTSFDVTPLVDMSLVKEAMGRLGGR